MRIKSNLQNFILYLLLLVLIAAGSSHLSAPIPGSGPVSHETSSLCSGASLRPAPVDFWAKHSSQTRQEISETGSVRNMRTGVSCRSAILFLFYVLTLLSVFSSCVQKILSLYDSRSVYKEAFIISFIQNTDGRKRLSWC